MTATAIAIATATGHSDCVLLGTCVVRSPRKSWLAGGMAGAALTGTADWRKTGDVRGGLLCGQQGGGEVERLASMWCGVVRCRVVSCGVIF